MQVARLERTESGYSVLCLGEEVRKVSPFDWDRTLAVYQIGCINEQARRHILRLARLEAAKEALRLCGKLTKSRARLTRKTVISANKAWGRDV